MTQTNINLMDKVVDELANGKTLSQALETVYTKRYVVIPFNEDILEVSVRDLNISMRTSNALMRAHLTTVKDVIDFSETQGIMNVKTLGKHCGIELFEAILDWSWDHMEKSRRVDFLMQTIEDNSSYIREELM